MARGQRTTKPNRIKAKQILTELWDMVLEDEQHQATDIICQVINADEVGMRFCLPTQLLGKLTDNTLDTLILQLNAGPPGNWNPRTFASSVVVPWNRANQNVLGASRDPYVSFPLRRPRLDAQPRQRADAEQWETICGILRGVEARSEEEYTRTILLQVLAALRERLRDLNFVYVVPDRVSLRQAEAVVAQFLAERSGGDRGLAVVAALFETIRERCGIYSEVRRGVINAPDSATGSVGDLECLGQEGNVVLAVEVKERTIGDDDLHTAIAKAREFEVNEYLFCATGITSSERQQVESTLQSAWASGTNIYHVTTSELMHNVLPLTGERGIKSFVIHIGRQLDAFNTQPKHRRAWKSLLDAL